MKVCVLGATGMLGHKLVMQLSDDFDTFALARTPWENVERFGIFKKSHYVAGVDVMNAEKLDQTLKSIAPMAVINAVGLTTRKLGAITAADIIHVNSWLPHHLQSWCVRNGARLIHFSTDCVFSGHKGGYTEDDTADAKDLYGRSKLLGEVGETSALTLRGSIVGREIFGHTELIEWLISQRGRSVKGFNNVIYSGVTTGFMSRFVRRLLKERWLDQGIYQISSPPISKYELLMRINQALGLDVTIAKDESYISDKSLNSSRLFKALPQAEKPQWDAMIEELKTEHKQYLGWHP